MCTDMLISFSLCKELFLFGIMSDSAYYDWSLDFVFCEAIIEIIGKIFMKSFLYTVSIHSSVYSKGISKGIFFLLFLDLSSCVDRWAWLVEWNHLLNATSVWKVFVPGFELISW